MFLDLDFHFVSFKLSPFASQLAFVEREVRDLKKTQDSVKLLGLAEGST